MDDHKRISRKYSQSKSKVIKLDKPFFEDSIILTDVDERASFLNEWDRPLEEKSEDDTCEFRSCVFRKHRSVRDEKLLKTTQSLKKEIPFTSLSTMDPANGSQSVPSNFLIRMIRKLFSC